MPKCIVFLRGINVGGRIVKKEELKHVFSSLGLTNAITFKQSGNIVIQAGSDLKILEQQIKSALKQASKYEIEVFIRTIEELKALAKLNPFKGKEEPGASFQVTFLSNKATLLTTFPIRIPNSTADIIGAQNREIFSITRGGGDGGKPNLYIERQLRIKATTRNWNIIEQIIALCNEEK